MPEKKGRVAILFWMPRQLRLEFKQACEREGTNMQANLAELMKVYIQLEKERSKP